MSKFERKLSCEYLYLDLGLWRQAFTFSGKFCLCFIDFRSMNVRRLFYNLIFIRIIFLFISLEIVQYEEILVYWIRFLLNKTVVFFLFFSFQVSIDEIYLLWRRTLSSVIYNTIFIIYLSINLSISILGVFSGFELHIWYLFWTIHFFLSAQHYKDHCERYQKYAENILILVSCSY